MAKFKYVGDPRDNFSGPPVGLHFGISFPKGEVVEVPEDTDHDKFVVGKLKGNTHLVDMSDREEVKAAEDQRKRLEKSETDRKKAEEDRIAAEETESKRQERAEVDRGQPTRQERQQHQNQPNPNPNPNPQRR